MVYSGLQADLLGSASADLPVQSAPCDFCAEISGDSDAYFRRLYRSCLSSRMLGQHGDFIAIPTVGQLFAGSLLVLPKTHIETLAQMRPGQHTDLEDFTKTLTSVVAPDSYAAIFEHGARQDTGASCGIYHAHLHIVPTPTPAPIDRIFRDFPYRVCTSLSKSLSHLVESTQYMVFGTTQEYGYVDLTEAQSPFPSQYVRKRLTEINKIKRPWDWREAVAPEADLMQTVELFGRYDVSGS